VVAHDVEEAVGKVSRVLRDGEEAIDEYAEDGVAQVPLGDRDRPEVLLTLVVVGQVFDLHHDRDEQVPLLIHHDAIGDDGLGHHAVQSTLQRVELGEFLLDVVRSAPVDADCFINDQMEMTTLTHCGTP
jgi:hypothetical protein